MKRNNLLLFAVVAMSMGLKAQSFWDKSYFNQMGHYPTSATYHEITIAEFDSAIKAEPKNPYPYCGRGEHKIIYGHFKQGNADMDSAISIADMRIKIHFFEEKEHYIYYGKAQLYYTFPQVISIYDKAIALFPDSSIVYADRCKFYNRHKMFKKAVADARKIIDLNPISDNYESLAEIMMRDPNEYPTEEILKVYNEYMKRYPNTGRAYLDRGSFYESLAIRCEDKPDNKNIEVKKERIQWLKKAISDFDTAIRLDPSNNQFKLALISCGESSHICSPDKILNLYDEYIKGESGASKTQGYLRKAFYCKSIHKYDLSVAAMDTVISLDPDNWDNYLDRASFKSHLGAGKKEEVKLDLQKAKALSIGKSDINLWEEYRRLQKIYGN